MRSLDPSLIEGDYAPVGLRDRCVIRVRSEMFAGYSLNGNELT